MLKLFLKIPSALRSIIMLVFAFGSYFLMINDNVVVQVIGYVLLGLMALCLFFDRRATKIEKEEKLRQEKIRASKSKVFVGKYPFEDTKDGYVLKWAYYNENIAGSRYLNIPYNDLKLGAKLTLVKDNKNSYDPNAIKVLYENKHLGYIHKNHIQEMFNKYSENDSFLIEAKLNSIDATNCKLQLQIGFYQKFSNEAFQINQIIKCAAVNTASSQEVWKNVHLLDYVRVDYNENGKIYLGNELLGELKASDVKKLSTFARDFRIIYRVGLLQGNDEKGTLSGRIDAYVLED